MKQFLFCVFGSAPATRTGLMRRAGVLLALVPLVVAPACVHIENDPWGFEEWDLLSALVPVSAVVAASHGYYATPSTPPCALQAAQAVSLSGTSGASSYAQSGQTCYYRVGSETVFGLMSFSGDADLYVGDLNDPAGGTAAYSRCSPTVGGGGWIRCSRVRGTGLESLTLTADQMPGTAFAEAAGDYRLLGVYALSPTQFSLSVSK